MGDSDSETEYKKKKEKKDKDKDKDKVEKKDKGKDKDKDEKKKDKDKDKDKGEKKKDKGKDEKKKDKDKDEKKDKKEKDEGKHKDEKGKEKDKDKKEKKDKKDEDEDEDEEDGKKKKKKDKDKDKAKDKDKKDKPSHPPGVNVSSGEAASYYNPSAAPSEPSQPPSQPAHPSQPGEVPWFLREPGTEPIQDQRPPRTEPGFPNPNPHYSSQPPPQCQPARAVGDVGGGQSIQVPPSGFRIPLDPNAEFPSPDQLGRPPTTDFDGLTPVFIGSAIFPDSVHPCKIIPSLHPPCRVSYNGSEVAHHGRYDLLPITQDMEWVPSRNGQIPPGRRPVEGGYESSGGKLYHALGFIQGVYVPGKAGDRLVSRSKLSYICPKEGTHNHRNF